MANNSQYGTYASDAKDSRRARKCDGHQAGRNGGGTAESQVSELRADFCGALKESAEETGKALDRVLSAWCTAAIQSAMTMANKADEKIKVKNTTGGGSAPEVSALPTILRPIIN